MVSALHSSSRFTTTYIAPRAYSLNSLPPLSRTEKRYEEDCEVIIIVNRRAREELLPARLGGSIRPPLASLTLLALLVGIFAVSCGGASGEQRAQAPAGDETGPVDGIEHPSLGDGGAPVVMTEYADFQ
jgi:hypothetical protein